MEPMQSPQLTCEHHYISFHQPDFPPEIYWVRICHICQHIIPEVRNEREPYQIGTKESGADAEVMLRAFGAPHTH